MKLENAEVSSQGSLALQLHEAKSKSKSGGRHMSSRDPAWAPQASSYCCPAGKHTRDMAWATASCPIPARQLAALPGSTLAR